MNKLIIISGVLLTAFIAGFYFGNTEVELQTPPPRPAVQVITPVENDIPAVEPVSALPVVVASPVQEPSPQPDQLIEVRNGVITIIGEADPLTPEEIKEITVDLTLPSRPQDDLWVAANMPKVLSRKSNANNYADSSTLGTTTPEQNTIQAPAVPLHPQVMAKLALQENTASHPAPKKVASLDLAKNTVTTTQRQVVEVTPKESTVSGLTLKGGAAIHPSQKPATTLYVQKGSIIHSPQNQATKSQVAKSQTPVTKKVNTTPANGVPEKYGDVAPSFPPLPPITLIKEGDAEDKSEAVSEETDYSTPTPIAKNEAPAVAAKKPTYDANGDYIEPNVKIDYGPWGGYQNSPPATVVARTPSDAEYLKWRNAQTYWENAQ